MGENTESLVMKTECDSLSVWERWKKIQKFNDKKKHMVLKAKEALTCLKEANKSNH